MKVTSKIKSTVVAAMAALTLSTVAHAQLLNGDFSGNASSFISFPGYASDASNPAAIQGWDTFTKLSKSGIGLGGTSLTFTTPAGSNTVLGPSDQTGAPVFAFLQNDSQVTTAPTLSQTVTGLNLSLTYVLTFDAAERAGSGTATAGSFTVSFGGVSHDIVFDSASFTSNTFTFVAPTNSDLVFTNLGTAGQDTTLDIANVTLTIAAVPEPSSYALGLLVLGVLAFEIRRRRALIA